MLGSLGQALECNGCNFAGGMHKIEYDCWSVKVLPHVRLCKFDFNVLRIPLQLHKLEKYVQLNGNVQLIILNYSIISNFNYYPRCCEIDFEQLMYHILVTLKPFDKNPFEVVLDCTNFGPDNRFKVWWQVSVYLMHFPTKDFGHCQQPTLHWISFLVTFCS